MAKLNGVTTVSERIQYNGADYVKSDEAAVKGDIIRFDDSSRCIKTGAFYEVTRIDAHDDPQIIDEESDEYDLCGMDFAVFKRVEVAQPIVEPTPSSAPTALPDAYVIHDGKVYVKEERKATEGESLIITNAYNYGWAYKNGDILTYRRDFSGDMVYVEGVSYAVYTNEYSVLVPTDSVTIDGVEYTLDKRKAAKGDTVLVFGHTLPKHNGIQTVTSADPDGHIHFGTGGRLPGGYYVLLPKVGAPQYREVKRAAEVGERIRIVTPYSTSGSYKIGDEFTVKSIHRGVLGRHDHVYVEGVEICIIDKEYVVLETIETTYEPQPGDKVQSKSLGYTRILKERTPHLDGEYGKVWKFVDGHGGWLGEKQFDVIERAADVKQAVTKSAEPEPRLKVGDYVKITQSQSNWPVGTIVRVTETDAYKDGGGVIRATDVKGTYLSNKYEPVTPVEAEQARKEAEEKAQQTALEAKWSAIGRKVGEYKAGDIVKTTDGCGHPIGTIGVICEVDGSEMPRVLFNGVRMWHTVELIAPVESLFNR